MSKSADINLAAGDGAGGEGGASPPPAILDVGHLDGQVVGDRKLRRELLQLYAGRLIALAPGICGAASPERRDAAHALKGASLAIGAFALARICDGVERDDEAARGEAAVTIEMTRRRIEDVLRQDG